jgi:hypothetical protein
VRCTLDRGHDTTLLLLLGVSFSSQEKFLPEESASCKHVRSSSQFHVSARQVGGFGSS